MDERQVILVRFRRLLCCLLGKIVTEPHPTTDLKSAFLTLKKEL